MGDDPVGMDNTDGGGGIAVAVPESTATAATATATACDDILLDKERLTNDRDMMNVEDDIVVSLI